MRVFFDTNVLVYSLDLHDDKKRTRSLALIRECLENQSAVISTQVLQEFFTVAVKKLKIEPLIARKHLMYFSEKLDVVQVTTALMQDAADRMILNPISFWDSLIVSAAKAGRCEELYTEDLQSGRVWDGVKVMDPFVD